jgi:triphosphoribosyl-dephospho-CoA synthase
MIDPSGGTRRSHEQSSGMTPGRLGQLACLLEVIARKPGNVHRLRDLPNLHFADFLLSAGAISGPLDRAAAVGVGEAIREAIVATRQVVATNTNLGIVLLLVPLAAVRTELDLADGIHAVLESLTVEESRAVYQAIRLAEPGGLGTVEEQDIASEPTVPFRALMGLAADRDLIARQYSNGFHQVLREALPALRSYLAEGRPLETAIVGIHLELLARYPDSLIARKAGLQQALEVSARAREVLDEGWPDDREAVGRCQALDEWLREPSRRFNPGTTADLVTAALYAALRDGTIRLPIGHAFPAVIG